MGELERLDTELRLRGTAVQQAMLRIDDVSNAIDQRDSNLAQLQQAQDRRRAYLAFRLREVYKAGSDQLLERVLGGAELGSYLQGLSYASFLSQRDARVLDEFHTDAALDSLIDALRVARLDSRESILSIRDRDPVPRLLGKGQGRFNRRVTAADHDDPIVSKSLRLSQRVADLGQVFPRYVQFAGCAAPADGQDHTLGEIRSFAGGHCKARSVSSRHLRYDLLAVHVQAGFGNDVFPDADEIFLRDLTVAQLAVAGDSDGARHDQFLARVMSDRATQVLFFDRRESQLVMQAVEGSAQAGGPAPDDQDVQRIRGTIPLLFDDPFHTLAALLESIADQPHATELADDVQARYVCLEVALDARELDPTLLAAKH